METLQKLLFSKIPNSDALMPCNLITGEVSLCFSHIKRSTNRPCINYENFLMLEDVIPSNITIHVQDQRLRASNVGAASFYPELTDDQLIFPQSFVSVRFSSRTMWILTQGL